MKAKTVLLTFDYELFQGEYSGSVTNCLLRPTRKIAALLDKHKAKGIFFVDMMYLHRLAGVAKLHQRAKCDFEAIERQVIELAENGHYIFNHIHPHWLDAVYNPANNDWRLDNISRYTFSTLQETEREYVFGATMSLLNEILSKARQSFAPQGFRAGGLYIQPFKIFKPYFEKYKICYDFSVLSGAKGAIQNSEIAFDFSEVQKSVYRFSEAVEEENSSGAFTEFSLRFAEIPFLTRAMNSVVYRLSKHKESWRKYGDGTPTSHKIFPPSDSGFSVFETFSIELLNEVKLSIYIEEINTSNVFQLISHPKLVSEKSLEVFDKFLSKVVSLHKVEFDFMKFKLSER